MLKFLVSLQFSELKLTKASVNIKMLCLESKAFKTSCLGGLAHYLFCS